MGQSSLRNSGRGAFARMVDKSLMLIDADLAVSVRMGHLHLILPQYKIE